MLYHEVIQVVSVECHWVDVRRARFHVIAEFLSVAVVLTAIGGAGQGSGCSRHQTLYKHNVSNFLYLPVYMAGFHTTFIGALYQNIDAPTSRTRANSACIKTPGGCKII